MTEAMSLYWFAGGVVFVGLALVVGIVADKIRARFRSHRAAELLVSTGEVHATEHQAYPPEITAELPPELPPEPAPEPPPEPSPESFGELDAQRQLIATLENNLEVLSSQVGALRHEVSKASVLQTELINEQAARSALQAELGDERAERAQLDAQVQDHLVDLLHEVETLSALLGVKSPAIADQVSPIEKTANGAAPTSPQPQAQPRLTEGTLPSALSETSPVIGALSNGLNTPAESIPAPVKTNGSKGPIDEADLAERIRVLKEGIRANA